MKKALFISYYWPPSGKASLQWPIKIIKHLISFGWQISVLTVEEDTFSQQDSSFNSEINSNINIIRAKSFEPFNIYKKVTGRSKDDQLIASETISTKNKKLSHKLSLWIRMNLFIPDARIGWYFPAIKKMTAYLTQERVDVIISIGPPHTTHLIAKKLSSKFRIPFVPVFIDPWTDIAYYKNFNRSKITLAIDNRLEKSVLKNSSANIFVTETMKSDYEKKYSFVKDKSNVLYWGYSEEEFDKLKIVEKTGGEKIIVHAGNLFSYQNPLNFWKQLKKEIDDGQKFIVKFIGTVDQQIVESINENGLSPFTRYPGFLNYKKMLEEVCNADFLLVCATEPRHVPGKLFEYLRAGKPIIAFGDGNKEVKNILEKANAGMMFEYKDSGKEIFQNQKLFKTDSNYVKDFERENISKKMEKLLSLILYNHTARN
jgi:glycosyltransferase involved in cell wall biosynthesis